MLTCMPLPEIDALATAMQQHFLIESVQLFITYSHSHTQMLTFMPLPEIDALSTTMQQPGYVPNTAQVRKMWLKNRSVRVLL